MKRKGANTDHKKRIKVRDRPQILALIAVLLHLVNSKSLQNHKEVRTARYQI